jgi:hypothetical protein
MHAPSFLDLVHVHGLKVVAHNVTERAEQLDHLLHNSLAGRTDE